MPNIGFCNLNAYVMTEAKVERYSLGLIELQATDGKSLSFKIKERLAYFNIDAKFVTIDGASNTKKMATEGGFLRQACILHGVNLAISDMLFSSPKASKILEFADVESENEPQENEDNELEDNEEVDEFQFELNDLLNIDKILFDENGRLKDSVQSMISDVRKLIVNLRRSTKNRNVLRKYNSLAPIVDVKTRWSSTYEMLVRFLTLLTDLKRAALDSDDIQKTTKFINPEVENIVGLVAVLLKPFATATKLLSAEGNTLITADLILSECYDQMKSRIGKEYFATRVSERRNYWSDILLYLCNESRGICFFEKPSDDVIASLYRELFPEGIGEKDSPIQQSSAAMTANERLENSKRPKVADVTTSSCSIETELQEFASSGKAGTRLKRLVHILSLIRPTSIDPERAFSICSMIITKKRCRLGSEKIDKILFLNENVTVDLDRLGLA